MKGNCFGELKKDSFRETAINGFMSKIFQWKTSTQVITKVSQNYTFIKRNKWTAIKIYLNA